MLSFNEYLTDLTEEKVNYNHHNQSWQVRGDESHHPLKDHKKHLILKDVKPHIDHEAHDSGKKVYAF